MAQINIIHFTPITEAKNRELSLIAREIAAKEVHGLGKTEIQPDSVTIIVIPVDRTASLSGADTEVQVLVSGNNWPSNAAHQPANFAEAKIHFDKMAQKFREALTRKS